MNATERPDRSEAIDRLLRLLVLTGIAATLIAGLLLAGRSARPQVIGWESAFVAAVVVLVIWHRLPAPKGPKARFTRGELMSATFMAIGLGGGGIVTDLIEGKMSAWRWLALPAVAIILFAGCIFADRRENDRIEQDLAEWRELRPHVSPKTRCFVSRAARR